MMNFTARILWFGATLVGVICFLGLLSVGFSQEDRIAGLTDVKVVSSMRPEFTLVPGEMRTGDITIENYGDNAAAIAISQADFRFDDSGELVYELAGSLPTSNAGWIEVGSQVLVPAGGRVDVPFVVRVPDDEPLAGTYWSLLMVEAVDPKVITGAGEAGADVRTSVEVKFQFGVTVLTHVGQSANREVLFSEPVFGRDDGAEAHHLRLKLHNPGAYLTAAAVWLELFDAQGNMVARVEGDEQRLYPGASVRVRFELGRLDAQQYQAIVVADAGGSNVFGIRYTLNVAPN